MSSLSTFHEMGQSLWLNYLRRAFIDSGQLSEAVEAGVSGITSTPTIFEKAITDSSDYDKVITNLVSEGRPIKETYEALVVDDVQRAADVLHPVFERTEGLDGYVTIELNPAVAQDSVGTIAEARHVLHAVNRPNVMIEVPATPAGIEAIETLTKDGIHVNATHIFSLATYEDVAAAYLKGLEEYLLTHSVWPQKPASVASISIGRIDGRVDQILAAKNRPGLQGQAGVAVARAIYHRFQEIFSGPHWQDLARRGGRVQRPKWTRTTPRDFIRPSTYYITSLVMPDSVCTLSLFTYNILRGSDGLTVSLGKLSEEDELLLAGLAEMGVDLQEVGRILQGESLLAFERYFKALIDSVARKRGELEEDWRRVVVQVGDYEPVIEEALGHLEQERVLCRIWEHDHTVWRPTPEEITNRLGWLHVVETMQENLGRLESFAHELHSEQGGREPFTHAVVLGMGGSSLAPELFAKVFGPRARLERIAEPPLEVAVLDTTDPDTVWALSQQLDLEKSLFIVASKSGTTVETLSLFRYFYNRVSDAVGADKAGRHFVAITDQDTPLAQLAEEHGFRDIFINDPTIGGRYSALSYFGLVPAILAGVDLERLLGRALGMVHNAGACNAPGTGNNYAARLGAAMGELALAGRDKLTLVASPAIASFADWLEQLIAESTGKDGKGIVPVVGEPLGTTGVYGDDRFFVHLHLDGDESQDVALDGLRTAGHPVVTINLKDVVDLGGQFFLWEMATAVAGHLLGIHPFDQPNVEAAKRLARDMVARYKETGELPKSDSVPTSPDTLHNFLSQAGPGDYIALQAYLSATPKTIAALQKLRSALRDRTQLATTLGFGPRYLHSTGQLHKGDRGNGLFVQFTSDPLQDLPIPNRPGSSQSDLTFGTLKMAQALGDGQALLEAGRRVIRFHLGKEVDAALEQMLLE